MREIKLALVVYIPRRYSWIGKHIKIAPCFHMENMAVKMDSIQEHAGIDRSPPETNAAEDFSWSGNRGYLTHLLHYQAGLTS